MKATFLDLRKSPKKLLEALEQNEEVTISYRGRLKGVIVPAGRSRKSGKGGAGKHPAFGLWADRKDMANVRAYVRDLRKGRVGAL